MTLTELIEKLSAIRQVYGGHVEVLTSDDENGETVPDPHYDDGSLPWGRSRPARVWL